MAWTPIAWTPLKVLYLLMVLVSGFVMFSALLVLGAVLCFWTVQSIEIINTVTYGGTEMASYPLPIYHELLQRFFTFVVPLAFVSYFPALYLLDRPEAAAPPRLATRRDAGRGGHAGADGLAGLAGWRAALPEHRQLRGEHDRGRESPEALLGPPTPPWAGRRRTQPGDTGRAGGAGGRRHLLSGGGRRDGRVYRAQRRWEEHHHQDAHRHPGAERRTGDGGRAGALAAAARPGSAHRCGLWATHPTLVGSAADRVAHPVTPYLPRARGAFRRPT